MRYRIRKFGAAMTSGTEARLVLIALVVALLLGACRRKTRTEAIGQGKRLL